MAKLKSASDILTLSPSDEARNKAAEYASRSLPWTFNRMMKNTSAGGQIDRALNIAKGIVAQEVLREYLNKLSIEAIEQKKSYRLTDFFDFEMMLGQRKVRCDVKTISYYSDYPGDIREKLTPELIFKYRGYAGPDWRTFFPMLLAHTQIKQDKEICIFGISESRDFRKSVIGYRKANLIAAFPFGESMPFYISSKLCQLREAAKKGFCVDVSLESYGLFAVPVQANILFEWQGKPQTANVKLSADGKSVRVGPMSLLSTVTVTPEEYGKLAGVIVVKTAKNDCRDFVPNSAMENINTTPSGTLRFGSGEFCNLVLPNEYKLHFVGWTTREEYLESTNKYTGWVWPIDSESKFLNKPWSQLTEKDLSLLEKLSLMGRVSRNPNQINVGLMKTTGRGQGACCYVFPNYFRGGVRETNFYVLPQDLMPMATLGHT